MLRRKITSKLSLTKNRFFSKYLKRKYCLSSLNLTPKNDAEVLKDKYDYSDVENKYRQQKYASQFQYKVNDTEETENYSIVLPPPNITGSLHLGHALTVTLQDVACRWERMHGKNVCWLPGMDHAGIATQVIVEKHLAQKNMNRFKLGREKFLEEIWKWKVKKEKEIREQLQRLGASFDWSRESFTMDANHVEAVKEAFIYLFDEGLIYRKADLVNWSCYLQSTISDIEIENIKITGPSEFSVPGYSQPITFGLMTYFVYKTDNDSEITIATTRPETILGDVAVAVHPDDKRYRHLIGCKLKHPFLDKYIPLITDNSVDMNFGTGALKVTPAHDRTDYIIAKNHNLPIISVIDEVGNICDGFSSFSKMKQYDARKLIIDQLTELKLLKEITGHSMRLPICSRSGDIIELLLREQWYLDCKKMSTNAINAIKDENIILIPSSFDKKWYEWLEKQHDWCISRQLWWGHQIPAYKCYSLDADVPSIWIAAHNLQEATFKAKLRLKSDNVICEQDNDVLDTWFSSALYPFSSHGWHLQTKQYEKLYPLNLMITGHDILCFWVVKMVMLGEKLTNKLPFPKVLLHSVICDSYGSKMSKSKGNVIDPQDIINGISLKELNKKTTNLYLNGLLSSEEKKKALKLQQSQYPNGIPECGVDALRFTLCNYNVKNHFINFDIEDCYNNKLFCNKIWQSVRFLLKMFENLNGNVPSVTNTDDFNYVDFWVLSRLSTVVKTVETSLSNFDFYIATRTLKQFLYNDICDFYIEYSKQNIKKQDKIQLSVHCHILSASFNTALRLLSPFMPYLTDELIPHIPLSQNFICEYKDSVDNLIAPKDTDFSKWKNEELEKSIEMVQSIISTIRHMKQKYNVSKDAQHKIFIQTNNVENSTNVKKHLDTILYLSKSSEVIVDEKNLNASEMWRYCYNDAIKIYLSVSNFNNVNVDHDFEKLAKKWEKLTKELLKLEKTVSNEGFNNAPENIRIKLNHKIIAMKEELIRLNKILNPTNSN